MAKVDLRKTVYNKNQFNRVVGGREFTTFTTPSLEESITVEEFFQAYEDLYLTIPVTGDTQSHEYLVRRSGDLVGFQRTTEDIQPLLEEITSLREQLLELQQTNIDLQIQATGESSEEFTNALQGIQNALESSNFNIETDILPGSSEGGIGDGSQQETTEPTLQSETIRIIATIDQNGNSPGYTINAIDFYKNLGLDLTIDSIVNQPFNGKVDVNFVNSTIKYTPNSNAVNDDSFRYILKSPKGQTVENRVLISIVNNQFEFQANNDIMNIVYNVTTGGVTGNTINILENDEGELLKFTRLVKPGNPNFCLTTRVDDEGNLTYFIQTSTLRQRGTQQEDRIVYAVENQQGVEKQASVNVNIRVI